MIVASADAEGLGKVVAADDAFFAAGAANELYFEAGGECGGSVLPGVIERAVVDEAYHGLARLRRLKFGLKEAVA